MRALHIIWTLSWNLAAVAIYADMLSICESPFQTIVVSGLALIYVTVISSSTIIMRMQIGHARVTFNHFIHIAKKLATDDDRQKISDVEEDAKEQWENFEKKNVTFYINMAFLFIIWLIAVLAIVTAL